METARLARLFILKRCILTPLKAPFVFPLLIIQDSSDRVRLKFLSVLSDKARLLKLPLKLLSFLALPASCEPDPEAKRECAQALVSAVTRLRMEHMKRMTQLTDGLDDSVTQGTLWLAPTSYHFVALPRSLYD